MTGLDASTALAWTQAIRTITDILGVSSIVTLYQAGNGIYDLFDEVLVLDAGKQIFYGPREIAKPWFQDLGFEYTTGANHADFLTGVTVPSERKIREGYEHTFPRTADDIRSAYQTSQIYRDMQKKLSFPDSESARSFTTEFKEAVEIDKHKSLPKHSSMTTPYMTQIQTLVKRQYQMMMGNKMQIAVVQISTLVQSLVAGSLFYMIPKDSSGLFLYGGTLFFAILYNRWDTFTKQVFGVRN